MEKSLRICQIQLISHKWLEINKDILDYRLYKSYICKLINKMENFRTGITKVIRICENSSPLAKSMLSIYQKNEKDVDFMRYQQNCIKYILEMMRKACGSVNIANKQLEWIVWS